MSNSQLVHASESYAQQINKHWATATHAIYETSRLLNEAKKELKPGHADTPEWLDFKRRLPFGDSVLKKLMVIGGYTPLKEPSLQQLLPPNYTIIYEVTRLDPKSELPIAIQDNRIHPKMRRQDFIQWRSSLRVPAKSPPSNRQPRTSAPPSSAFASLEVAPDFDSNAFTALHKDLVRLEKKHNLTVCFGKQASSIKLQARQQRCAELRAELHQQISRVSSDLSHEELDLIESTAFQMRRYQDKLDREAKGYSSVKMIYEPTDSVSIEHPDHPYSVKTWNNRSFFQHLNDRNIVTQWTPVERLKGFGDLEMLARAVALLETSSTAVRQKHLTKLRNVTRRKSTNAPHAKRMLILVEGLI